MARTVIFKGETFSGVQGVALPISGGSEAIFTDCSSVTTSASDVMYGKQYVKADGTIGTGTYVFDPYGLSAELVATYDMGTTKLSDTGFNTWTPANSQFSIKATSILGTISANMSKYEYFTKMVFESNTSYVSGTTEAFATLRQIIVSLQYMYRKPNNITKMTARNYGYNYCTTLYTAPWIEYKAGSGNLTMAWTNSVGIYGAVAAHTFSSSTSSTPTITIKAPVYYTKCSDSYFNTTMAAAVDKDASTIKCKVYVYRIDKSTSVMYKMFHEIVELYNA